MPAPTASPRPVLHVVVLSHLDSQWRWTLRDTIERFLPRTVAGNDALFATRPRWTLSFEGALRYRLLARHHPELFARLRARVAEGRWHPAGAAVEAFDTLLPAPESILRQIHYGQRWFRRALGRESADLFLPDCFGFPATLPTLAAHAGLAGFSTQKLRRGAQLRAARPIPFAYGIWRGADGGELLAALDPGEYGAGIEGDLSCDPAWAERFAELARAGRPARLMVYAGVGDRGGPLPVATLDALAASLDGGGPVEVRNGPSDRIFLETTAAERARLPVHQGELLLRRHGTGCYTSRASLKRWNRLAERLARAAEAAAAAAARLGRPAPRGRLEEAWWRLLAHQMHDDLTGTAIPAAYRISHADLALASGELAQVLLDSAGAVARALDRTGAGRPLLLFNPLGEERHALVETAFDAAGEWHVEDAGAAAPAQRVRLADGRPGLCLAARLAPFEFRVVRLLPGAAPDAGAVTGGRDQLDNGDLRARFDAEGNLASLFDRRLGRELLAAPLRLELFEDRSAKYPAWEILYDDLARGPRTRFGRPERIELVEAGPLRAALEIERVAGGARVVERWSLAAGAAGDRLECAVRLDWRTPATLLKAAYPLATSNPDAAYGDGLGLVRRPVADESLYEVPAQGWAALDDPGGGGGTAVLADLKAGWDHPDPGTLRLTWIHAPRASLKWRHQRTQDFGRHRFRIALAGFAGDPVAGGVPALAERFAHPVLAFAVQPGRGGPDRDFKMLSVEGKDGLVQALKAADDSERLVVRLRNPAAHSTTVTLRGHAQTIAAFELDGRERERAPLALRGDGAVEVLVPPHGLATVGLDLSSGPAQPPQPRFAPLPLTGSLCFSSSRGEPAMNGGFDGAGRSFPREIVPLRIEEATVPFDLGHLADGRTGVVACDGRTLALPAGWAELWLLAASVAGDREVRFGLDGRVFAVTVPDWRAPLFAESRLRPRWLGGGVVEEAIRRVPVAFVSPSLRDRRGRDLVVEPGLLFALCLPVAGARSLALPHDAAVRVVAATLADAPAALAAEGTPLLA